MLVSLPKDDLMRLPIFQTVLHGSSVIGCVVGTHADLAEAFRLHRAGRVTARIVLTP